MWGSGLHTQYRDYLRKRGAEERRGEGKGTGRKRRLREKDKRTRKGVVKVA